MILTRHAIERYREFHMLDKPGATDEDARQVLEQHIDLAVKTGAKTKRGDQIWCIEALGIEVVTKNNEPDVCVTVLPPPEFRGLQPLHAEAVYLALQERTERLAELERELSEAPVKTAKEIKAEAARDRVLKSASDNQASLKRQVILATAERDTLCSVLKTMRVQLRVQLSRTNDRQALKLALQFIRRLPLHETEDVLAAIRAIDLGLVSDAFVYG